MELKATYTVILGVTLGLVNPFNGIERRGACTLHPIRGSSRIHSMELKVEWSGAFIGASLLRIHSMELKDYAEGTVYIPRSLPNPFNGIESRACRPATYIIRDIF